MDVVEALRLKKAEVKEIEAALQRATFQVAEMEAFVEEFDRARLEAEDMELEASAAVARAEHTSYVYEVSECKRIRLTSSASSSQAHS